VLLYIGFSYTWGKGYQRSLLLTFDKSTDGEEYENYFKPIPSTRDSFPAALSTAIAGSIETMQSDESTDLINLRIDQIPSYGVKHEKYLGGNTTGEETFVNITNVRGKYGVLGHNCLRISSDGAAAITSII